MNRKHHNPWLWIPSLYFTKGLFFVTMMILSLVLYKQMQLDNARITFYISWLYLPWLIRPLWKPFADHLLGRRWWILLMQLLFGAALGGVAFTVPTSSWLQGSLLCFWLIAFSSATHHISARELFIHETTDSERPRLFLFREIFSRLAMIFGQGVLVMIAGNLQLIYRNSIGYSWSLMFYGTMGLVLALWLWNCFALPSDDDATDSDEADRHQIWARLMSECHQFIHRPGLWYALPFFIFYCMPQGLLQMTASLFLIDLPHNGGLGLSPQEFGLVQGTVGVIGLTIGSAICGIVIGKHGFRGWKWMMACAMTLPNAVYVYLSYVMPSSLVSISMSVFIEQTGYGFGLTAYMLYLFKYCGGNSTFYSLCTALLAFSLLLPGLFAGALQMAMGYRMFFVLVMITCPIVFIVTAFLKVTLPADKEQSSIS